MLPPHPQLSLPTPQNRTLNGSGCPFAARRSASVLPPGWFTYSHQAAISRTVPLPTLPTMNGSAPNRRTSSRYSCVPKLLSSVTPPQTVFTILGRCAGGPIPSSQW